MLQIIERVNKAMPILLVVAGVWYFYSINESTHNNELLAET